MEQNSVYLICFDSPSNEKVLKTVANYVFLKDLSKNNGFGKPNVLSSHFLVVYRYLYLLYYMKYVRTDAYLAAELRKNRWSDLNAGPI